MYKIAGLYVDMVPKYKKTQIQSEDYKTNEADTANKSLTSSKLMYKVLSIIFGGCLNFLIEGIPLTLV